MIVPVSRSVTKIDSALRKAKNDNYTIVILPRAAHNFNISPEPGEPFDWPRVAPGFPELLTDWVNPRVRKAR
jgi:hypothetical protein